MPILRAVPSIIFIALIRSFAFKSGNFILLISFNCSVVIEPIIKVLGVEEPFFIFAAFANKIEAGGVFKMKVKLLSSKIEISTGIIRSFLSSVRELYSLQNEIMFKPYGPNAGPIGGAGLALPAGKANLTNAINFFDINEITDYKLLKTPKKGSIS